MPADLPTTAIGLIAFIVAGAAYIIVRLVNQKDKMIKEQQESFITYIEKKNGILERTGDKFITALEERDKRYDDMLIRHDERQQQMMDDMGARLEASGHK